MILLDTHIWMWWIGGDGRLPSDHLALLNSVEADGVAISAISCMEVARKAVVGKLELGLPIREWMAGALATANLRVEPITAPIAIESILLPDNFHKDPADRLIVATARVLDIPLLTTDAKIMQYSHVKHALPRTT